MDYRIDDSTALVELAGELDHHTLRSASMELTRVIEDFLPKTLVLDMSRLKFMDSSGLALVIGGSRKLGEFGGHMIVRNPPPQPKKVLDAGGVGRFVTIEMTGRVCK